MAKVSTKLMIGKGCNLSLHNTTKFKVLGIDVKNKEPEACQALSKILCEPYQNEEVTFDELNSSISVFQLKRGHRFSNDDLFVAWRACFHHPDALTLLDLGSGIGSVGLSTFAKMRNPKSTLIGVEAQYVSYQLASESRRQNKLEDRVRFFHGDLRNIDAVLASEEAQLIPPPSHFDLITGSPPYLPADHSLISPIEQRARCRVELRGSLYDYCEAAAKYIKPNTGRFVFVMLAQDPRTEDAPLKNGFTILERWDYTFMGGRKSHIATLVCAIFDEENKGAIPERVNGEMLIRDVKTGSFTPEHIEFKRFMRDSESKPTFSLHV